LAIPPLQEAGRLDILPLVEFAEDLFSVHGLETKGSVVVDFYAVPGFQPQVFGVLKGQDDAQTLSHADYFPDIFPDQLPHTDFSSVKMLI